MGQPVRQSSQEITHKRILHMAVPIVLGNITVPILGVVDTGVVGQLGEAAPIGAVGIGAWVLSALIWVFGFLRMGTTGMTAQVYGSGDRLETSAMLMRALMIAFVVGLGMIVFQAPLIWAALQASPASPEVESLARTYLKIRIFSTPAAVGLYAITGWMIAIERARGVMWLQLLMNAINILLDLWFVLGLGWGVGGVAFATLIAEWSGLAFGLYLCRDAFQIPGWANPKRILDRVILRRMAVVNSDILIRSLLLQAIFVSFAFVGASFSDVELAANQVLLQFLTVTAYAMDGFAYGAEALVGQAVGARNRRALRRASVMASYWAAGIAITMGLCFWLFGPWIIDLMTTAEDVRVVAKVFLIYMVLSPILGWPSWMLDGIFIGATRSADMRNMMAISALAYAVALYLLMPIYGNHGLWIALLISLTMRGITLFLRYPALERSVQADPS